MRSWYRQVLKFLVFLSISAFLFWLVYRDQNLNDLLKVLQEDVDYTWIGIVAVVAILSHVVRALRWQLLTASMGYPIRFMNGFMGVMIGYFANLAIPRMGEFTRCGVVAKYENVPFSKLLGTVVTERIIDMILLLILTLTVILLQFKQVIFFLDSNKGIEERVVSLMHSWKIGIVILVIPVFLYGLWKLFRGTKFQERLKGFLSGLKEGILTIRNVKHKWLFVGYSVLIWVLYFLMFYLCFFCFEFTSHLGILVGLTVFVLGSYGMVAPVQGGIGAWHFMIISALMLYLPDTPEMESLAKAFALLTHSAMTLMYIVFGVVCLIALPLYNTAKRNK